MLIVATIGLRSSTEHAISRIILAGADMLRYNFAHRLIAENIESVHLGRRVIDNLNSNTKILIDLPTNKVRLGNFDDIFYPVRENQELIFKSATFSPNCNDFVPVDTEHIGNKMAASRIITIGDGEVAFEVAEIIDPNTIRIRALNNGMIKTMRTLNAKLFIEDESYIKYCKDIIEKIVQLNPDYIGIPYINEGIYGRMVDNLSLKTTKPKIIIKIEGDLPSKEIEQLYQNSLHHTVLIDLGELGVNAPFVKVGNIYKKIMEIKNKYKKNTLVMTQLLESAANNYIPYRAEIINLTNMIDDGIDGIVLGYETALSSRPAYVISSARKIIEEVEQQGIKRR